MVALILLLIALVTLVGVLVLNKDAILKIMKKRKKQKKIRRAPPPPPATPPPATEIETPLPPKPTTITIDAVDAEERDYLFNGESTFGSMGLWGKASNNQYVCSGRKLLERDVPTVRDQFTKCSKDPDCNFVMYDKDNDNLYSCEGVVSQEPHMDMGEKLYFYKDGSFLSKQDYNIYENDETLRDTLKPYLEEYGYDYGGWTLGTGLCANTNIKKYNNFEEGLPEALKMCTKSKTCTEFLYDMDNNTVYTCEAPDGDADQTLFIRADQYAGDYDVDLNNIGKRVKFIKDFSKQVDWDSLLPFCDEADCYGKMLLGIEYEGKGVKCTPSKQKTIENIDACYLNSGASLISREKLTGCLIDGKWQSLNNDAHELCTSDPDCTHVSIFASAPDAKNQVNVMMETNNCDKDEGEFVPIIVGDGEHEVSTELYEGHMKFSDLYKRTEEEMIEGGGEYHPDPNGLEYPSYERGSGWGEEHENSGEFLPVVPPYICRKFTDPKDGACRVKTLSRHKPINYLVGCWGHGTITDTWVCSSKQYPHQRTYDWEACPYQMPSDRRWIGIKDENGKVVRCIQPPDTPEEERVTYMSAHCDVILNDLGTTNGCIDTACQWNNYRGNWTQISDESICDSFTSTPAQSCNEGCLTTGLETDVKPGMCARNGDRIYQCMQVAEDWGQNLNIPPYLGGYTNFDEATYEWNIDHADLGGNRAFEDNGHADDTNWCVQTC